MLSPDSIGSFQAIELPVYGGGHFGTSMEKMPLISLFQPLTADTFAYPSTVSTGLKKGD